MWTDQSTATATDKDTDAKTHTEQKDKDKEKDKETNHKHGQGSGSGSQSQTPAQQHAHAEADKDVEMKDRDSKTEAKMKSNGNGKTKSKTKSKVKGKGKSKSKANTQAGFKPQAKRAPYVCQEYLTAEEKGLLCFSDCCCRNLFVVRNSVELCLLRVCCPVQNGLPVLLLCTLRVISIICFFCRVLLNRECCLSAVL